MHTFHIHKYLCKLNNLHLFYSYSDIEIILDGDEKLPAHKFVLNARSTKWNLKDTNLLDWSHLPEDVGMAILSWIYNDQVITTLLEPLQNTALTKKSSTSFSFVE